MSGPIDLSRLPPPAAVETLSFERLLGVWRDRAAAENPALAGLESEADPSAKWLRTGAYREGLVRQRVNDAARSVMLAFARGADLENLAALFGIRREVVVAADSAADPPVEEVLESDDRLLRRTQLFPASVSTAGPKSAYRFHALSASALVKDVDVASPGPGQITLTVLQEIVDPGDTGIAGAALLKTVTDALGDESVRPLGDVLAVQTAAIVDYTVTAELTIGTGPDAGEVLAAARTAVSQAALDAHRLGAGAPRSVLIAALHVPGVAKVELASPAADVAATSIQAAHASVITVTAA